LTDIKFSELGLSPEVLKVIEEVGYDSPSPIQAGMIPYVLDGRDVLGQAQTGTGKTAAFALPILSKIDLNIKKPQVLVLAPTRELAIQVAESFHGYSKHMKGFHVLPIYGGQDYGIQLRGLKRNPQVIVGTPGRVMDHIKKGTLVIDELKTMVLDEADEMLNMGFLEDVEWVLKHTPEDRQIALFSATMPSAIKKITQRYLNDPAEVIIKSKSTTASTIRQRFWMVSGLHKVDALTRILEVEDYDGIIIFVRTKSMTLELQDKLNARGYAAAGLNGDMNQAQREKTVNQLKKGKLDILIGTDIVARGLDINRISHVINYDIPYDTESYVHRIGRTGRAGKNGEAILFVAPRERNLLRMIERATKKPIERMEMPSTEDVNNTRVSKFKQQITDELAQEGLEYYAQIVESYQNEHNIPAEEIAAALIKIARKGDPLRLKDFKEQKVDYDNNGRGDRGEPREFREAAIRDGFARYRVSVGEKDRIKPGNLVGAIANEAKIDASDIAKIAIYSSFSTVDLPDNLSDEKKEILINVMVSGKKLDLKDEIPGEAANEPRGHGGGRGDSRDRGGRGGRSRDGGRRGDSRERGSRDRSRGGRSDSRDRGSRDSSGRDGRRSRR
jgi:ATP-dependent RNA helicase DeaD